MSSSRFFGAGTVGLFLFIFCRFSLSANIENVAVPDQLEIHTRAEINYKTALIEDTDLPSSVLTALSALDADTLLSVLDLAVTSTEIFGEIILYLTLSWAQTGCEWINDIAGAVEDGWNYVASGEVIDDAVSVAEDVLEMCNPANWSIWFEELDTKGIPETLLDDIHNLVFVRKDYTLARLKYNVWKFNGIVWTGNFVQKLGFKSDDQMRKAMNSALKTMYDAHFENKDTADVLEADDLIDCSILDPIELINPHYVKTLPLISSFLVKAESESLIKSDTTGVPAISIAFVAEACAEFIATACVGGGFGFAVDLMGEAIAFELIGGSIGVSSPSEAVGDVDANFIVSFGIYESIEAIPGNALVGAASATTTFGGIGASMAWSMDTISEIPIGIEFACSFDLTMTEFAPTVSVSLGYVYTEQIATLANSGCSAMAVGVDYDEMMKGIDFPKIGGPLNEHLHIRGGSSGKALITVPLDYEDYENTVEYKEFGGKSIHFENKKNGEKVFSISSINPQSMSSYGNNYLFLSLIILTAACITSVGCYGKKFLMNNKDHKLEHEPLL